MPSESSASYPREFLARPGNSFVLPEHKIAYQSVTKAACTSLRWMLADLAGEDLESFTRGASGVQSRLMTIHRGVWLWDKVRTVSHMSDEEVAEIRPDNGWFVFAVTRDPWSRLWSAWQSKFLVRHNRYLRNFGDAPFFPRVPQQPSDVVEDFARFVEMHPWTSDPVLRDDRHFWMQVNSVRPSLVPYTEVYDLKDFSRLVADVHTHLAGLGKDRELYLPRANENPLGLTREVMGGGVREAIEELYAPDFETFGDRWSFDDLRFTADGWTPDALSHVATHTVANDWIGHLAAIAQQRGKRSRKLKRKLDRANARIADLEAQLAGRSRRLPWRR
jgi:sulfotransferase famil protein